MRIFPRTIAGQIAGLIGMSVVIAIVLNFVAFYFILVARDRAPRPPGPFQLFTVAQLADAAQSADEAAMIAKRANAIGIPVEFVSAAQERRKAGSAIDPQPEAQRFLRMPEAQLFGDRLSVQADGEVRLALKDGSALHFLMSRPPWGFPGFVGPEIILILMIIAATLILVTLYAARSITAPLSSFVRAAHTIGTGLTEEGLSERGPEEIAYLARALNKMRDRIRLLLDERTRMLVAISHDLRTPLTRMKLRTEKLVSEKQNVAVANGFFADITRMEQMLSEALQYMRERVSQEPSFPVDLPSVLETICVELADLGKAISYEGPPRLVYRCRVGALTRAISNFVDNSLKNGTTVFVRLLECADGAIQIDVEDDGPGIPLALRDRVFEPFFKANSARTLGQNDGFGLGLTIAFDIVEAHGGSIKLLDRSPHGLIVRVVLPSQAHPESTAAVG
jgi:signal transduction histidine kinase